MRTTIALTSFIALCACATDVSRSTVAESNAVTLAALMVGEFETARDDPDNTIRDMRMRVSGPDGGVWIYYQLNTGEDWKVYRQRVIELVDDGDAVIQKTYALNSPSDFVDFWERPSGAAVISDDDIEPYFDDGCEQRWVRDGDAFQGYVDPAGCKIFSERRQANISIEAEARLDAEAYRQTERGFDEKGQQLFGTKPGEFIVLYRKSRP